MSAMKAAIQFALARRRAGSQASPIATGSTPTSRPIARHRSRAIEHHHEVAVGARSVRDLVRLQRQLHSDQTIAAARLIVQQAGGAAEILRRLPQPHRMSFLATNAHIHDALKRVILGQ